jgi:hypothetical protein
VELLARLQDLQLLTELSPQAPGGEKEILELMAVGCRPIAEQLLGEGIRGPIPTPVPYHNKSGKMAGDGRRNTRGIYAQLPRGAEDPIAERLPLREQPGAHFDSAATDDSMTHNRFMVTGLSVYTRNLSLLVFSGSLPTV